jgi:ABC-type transport system substrate-binding protein
LVNVGPSSARPRDTPARLTPGHAYRPGASPTPPSTGSGNWSRRGKGAQSTSTDSPAAEALSRDLTGAGSGPYKFVSWQPDNQIVLDRNPDYWDKDADGTQLPYAVYFGLGQSLQLPVPAVLAWAYAKDNPPYTARDVDKTKQELQSAGVSNVSFTFQISNASPQLQQIAELVQNQLKDVGITMEIQLIEFATVIQNGNTGDYQALSLGWSGSVDPDGNLYPLLYTKAGFNFAKYGNAEFDKLLDAGRTNLEQAKRGQAYLDAQKILCRISRCWCSTATPRSRSPAEKSRTIPRHTTATGADLAKAWRSK